MGWRVVNDALQIMGGEGYMTENEVERIFRDSRINIIVEGANEVMQSFIFAYGGKQLAEKMLGVQQRVGWDADQSFFGNLGRITKNLFNPTVLRAALPLASELYLGIRPGAPTIEHLHSSLRPYADQLTELVRDHSHHFKKASKVYADNIIAYQTVQARLADSAMYLHAIACVLSKLDQQLRAGASGVKFDRDKAAAIHFIDIAEHEIRQRFHALFDHDDDSMRAAARAAMEYSNTLPNNEFVIPERSPNAKGTGRVNKQDGIKQFPGDGAVAHGGNGDQREPREPARQSELTTA
jgi:hypothetical protein